MTDTAGDKPPFPGFPGFPPVEMLDNMWGMMRLMPFGTAFPSMQSGAAQSFGAPLSAMSDLMKPLMSVEELDKRITDMRAVEQWLKLNLNMLQSAIQALEVQRATLATLSAFGAFAQASMTQPETASNTQTKASSSKTSSPWTTSAKTPSAPASGESHGHSGGADAAPDDVSSDDASRNAGAQAAAAGAGFDPSGWWNLLQSQFNQLAAFAMTQPGAAGGAASADAEPKAPASTESAPAGESEPNTPRATPASAASSSKPSAKRASPRKSGAKPTSTSGSGGARGEK